MIAKWCSNSARLWMYVALACVAGNPWGSAAEQNTLQTAMANRVDQLLAQRWEDASVKPMGLSSDTEFLRRVHLDLTGVIPTVNDVRQFLADTRPDKRSQLIASLLARPNHATHFANVWRSIMLRSDNAQQQFGQAGNFEQWLRGKFVDNVPYNQVVTELLTTNGNIQNGPALFYTSLMNKPEELASSSSRIFLGVQISCAQCHDHPFDHWTRKDFWGYAAFFARLNQPQGAQQFVGNVVDANVGEVTLPGSDEPVPPQFLGGSVAELAEGQSRRNALAAWITSPQNPYFAKATVNRVWALMFGRGLVEPVDDLGPHNLASHPELLAELSNFFIDSGFDLRLLISTLAHTRAYQLSSEVPPSGEPAPELFARMSIKSLNAEQIYDCLREAMRQRDSINPQQQQFGRGFDQTRQAFLARFEAPTQAATEFQAGIPQALTLMNGAMIAQATNLENSDVLNALEAPFFTDQERVEILFMSTISRPPTSREQTQFITYVETAAKAGTRRKALGDVLWALLNSGEFIFNH